MLVIPSWDQFLPCTFLFVCGCFRKLLGYSSFRDSSLKPNFIAFFPTGDTSDPCWRRVLSFRTLGRRLPGIGIYRGDCSESFDVTATPVDIGIRGFEEGVTQDEIVSSNVHDKECMRGFLTIVID